jgi:cytochrome c peroxidase
MRRRSILQFAICNLQFAILLLAGGGCQPAGHYGQPRKIVPVESSPQAQGKPAPRPPLSADLRWQETPIVPPRPDTPIEFVHEETDRDEWRKLPAYWNAPAALTDPKQAAAVLGLAPLTAGALAALPQQGAQAIKIKVPPGLDDPRHYIPAANPPTFNKWELGRRLFFDKTYLTAKGGESCADCHVPDRGYTDNRRGHQGFNTATLVNCVFNGAQFWDGRATYLEEVVQRTLEDEQETEQTDVFRHVWGGAIRRLREPVHVSISYQFTQVFGCEPTQDAVGRAIATYLRTILAGNSLHDRAVQRKAERRATALEPADYEAVLDDAALKALGREGKAKAEVAGELHRGYRLFYNQDTDHKANCVACHSGRAFTDSQFHNLGVNWFNEYRPGVLFGRVAHAPLGQLNRYLLGAYKTPTLRSLSRTTPYFHDGQQDDLKAVVRLHEIPTGPNGNWNYFIDPEFRDPKNPDNRRRLDLSDADVNALVLFLKALNGDEVDPFIKAAPPPP